MRPLHVCAGLAALPVLMVLPLACATGPCRSDIEAWLDRPYEDLAIDGPRAPPSAEVRAAILAVPGSAFDHYQMASTATGAAQVLVARSRVLYRVYVEPSTLRTMHVVEEDLRPLNRLARVLAPLLAYLPAPLRPATTGAANPPEPGTPGFADVCTTEPEAYLQALDAVVPLAAGLRLPHPVRIAPPALPDGDWTVSFQDQHQPLHLHYLVHAGHAVQAGTTPFPAQRSLAARWDTSE